MARSGQSPRRKVERGIIINRDCLNLQPTCKSASICPEKETLLRKMPTTQEQHKLPEHPAPVMSVQ